MVCDVPCLPGLPGAGPVSSTSQMECRGCWYAIFPTLLYPPKFLYRMHFLLLAAFCCLIYIHILVLLKLSVFYDPFSHLNVIALLFVFCVALTIIVTAFQTTETISLRSRVPGGELHTLSSKFMYTCLFIREQSLLCI